MPRISRTSLKRQHQSLDRLVGRWDDGTRFAEIHRRTRFSPVPDGFRPSSGIGTIGGSGTSSVEGAVEGRIEVVDGAVIDQHRRDRVQDECELIFAALREAADAMSRAERCWHQLEGLGDPDPPGICMACGRTVQRTVADPIRRGLCKQCDTMLRYEQKRGPVDWVDFCRRRKDALAERERERV